MRLVDVDKIGLTDFEIVMCEGSYKNALEAFIYKISNAPTIEAIPITWLEEKLINHPEIPYAVTDGINAVLDMWREEKND